MPANDFLTNSNVRRDLLCEDPELAHEHSTFSYRRDKVNYYLDVAETVLKRGSCLRRNFGAVIVNNDQIISSGYTGAPRGRKNCLDLKECRREKFNIPRGERYEFCRSVHAEANAIIHASREKMIGSILFLVGIETHNKNYVENTSSCSMCKRLIINSGIIKLFSRINIHDFCSVDVNYWIENDESLTNELGY
ncbi:MAG: cytidine deaminase [Oscillospiraceae bacterium]|jgi:dCMP deaminase|nr:cytidine deaminase [Oscillospiraceae bacterium]